VGEAHATPRKGSPSTPAQQKGRARPPGGRKNKFANVMAQRFPVYRRDPNDEQKDLLLSPKSLSSLTSLKYALGETS
jgi:hypothetical protein